MAMISFIVCALFCLLSINILTVISVIPKPCAGNFTKSPSYCCPTPSGFAHACGYPSRGVCEPIQVYRSVLTAKFLQLFKTDIRFRWPERIFKYLCTCRGQFWGPDCSDCWYGYTGPNCTQRVTYERRNVLSYSKEERRRLVDVFMKVREVKSDYVIPKLRLGESRWSGEVTEVDPMELINFIHFLSAVGKVTGNRTLCYGLEGKFWNYGHMDSGFLAYHRYLLMFWERLFRRVARKYFNWNNFTLPYWDWTNSRKCDVCTHDIAGVHSKEFDNVTTGYFLSPKSPFGTSKWKTYCQEKEIIHNMCHPCTIDKHKASRLSRVWLRHDYPTSDEIIELLSLPNYMNYVRKCQSFEDVMEASWNCICEWKSTTTQLHAKVHQFIHGSFGQVGSTCYDPVFFLHHTQIDRLFERYSRGVVASSKELRNLPRSNVQCRECYIGTFIPPVKVKEMWSDTRQLGYTYDNFDFGSVSEKVKITRYDNENYVKKCPMKKINMVQLNFKKKKQIKDNEEKL